MILTLGTTDLLFALDSIPAIFGITQEPYLVLTANIFALMGLRQLYFLIGGLLQRLIYLSYGLAFLLAFIGVKLFFHALHENELPFINGGEPLDYAWLEIPIWLSLASSSAPWRSPRSGRCWPRPGWRRRSRMPPPVRVATGKTTDHGSRRGARWGRDWLARGGCRQLAPCRQTRPGSVIVSSCAGRAPTHRCRDGATARCRPP